MLRKSVIQTRESVSLEADLWQSKQEYITRKMNTPQLIFFKGPLVRWISSSPKLNQKFSQKTQLNEQIFYPVDMRHTRIVRVVALKDHEFSRYFLCSTYRQTPLCELDESKARIVLLLSCEHLFFFFFFFTSIRVVWSQCMIGEIASSSRVSGVGLLLLNMTAHGSRCKKVISFTKQIHRGFFSP